MIWTATVNYGGGDIAQTLFLVDDYKDKADWNSYTPGFNFSTTAAATITIFGTLGGANTLANENGNVGFDDFSFDVIELVPEPSPALLFGAGLALVAVTATRFRRNRSGERC
jgi:hypothetical protein